MPSWPLPPYFPSWSCDESNRLILLKVPEQVQIAVVQEGLRVAPSLPSLPLELHYTIIHHLPPVDRVCLALTYRRMCANVLSSPRLNPESWSTFTDIADFSNQYCSSNATDLTIAPEHNQLHQRLAHGWVNKKEWRYCVECHKILPRSVEWWWKSRDQNGAKRLQARRNPRWSEETGVKKEEWSKWARKKRLTWLVDVWCKASWEDGSIGGCKWCRDKLDSDNADRTQVAVAGETPIPNGNRDTDVMNFVGTKYPVRCPSCLEEKLTGPQKPPRRVKVKKKCREIRGRLRELCFKLIWYACSNLLRLIMFIWLLVEWSFRVILRQIGLCIPGGQRIVGLCW